MNISYKRFNTELKNCFGCLLYTGSHTKYLPLTSPLCLLDGCVARIQHETFDSCGSGGDRIYYPCEIRECPIEVIQIEWYNE